MVFFVFNGVIFFQVVDEDLMRSSDGFPDDLAAVSAQYETKQMLQDMARLVQQAAQSASAENSTVPSSAKNSLSTKGSKEKRSSSSKNRLSKHSTQQSSVDTSVGNNSFVNAVPAVSIPIYAGTPNMALHYQDMMLRQLAAHQINPTLIPFVSNAAALQVMGISVAPMANGSLFPLSCATLPSTSPVPQKEESVATGSSGKEVGLASPSDKCSVDGMTRKIRKGTPVKHGATKGWQNNTNSNASIDSGPVGGILNTISANSAVAQQPLDFRKAVMDGSFEGEDRVLDLSFTNKTTFVEMKVDNTTGNVVEGCVELEMVKVEKDDTAEYMQNTSVTDETEKENENVSICATTSQPVSATIDNGPSLEELSRIEKQQVKLDESRTLYCQKDILQKVMESQKIGVVTNMEAQTLLLNGQEFKIVPLGNGYWMSQSEFDLIRAMENGHAVKETKSTPVDMKCSSISEESKSNGTVEAVNNNVNKNDSVESHGLIMRISTRQRKRKLPVGSSVNCKSRKETASPLKSHNGRNSADAEASHSINNEISNYHLLDDVDTTAQSSASSHLADNSFTMVVC